MSTKAAERGEREMPTVSRPRDRDAEIDALEDAPTGAPMEARHWMFLVLSGIVLPVLILFWGWA